MIAPRYRPLACAVLGSALATLFLLREKFWAPFGQSDFDVIWEAARALRHGQSPYAAIAADSAYPERFPLFYPLPAVLLGLPFSWFPFRAARLIFVALGGAVLGGAIGWRRPEIWPVLMSFPFLHAAHNAQWTPYLAAALLVPAWGFVAAAKPNLGLAVLAGSRSRRAAILLVAGSAVVMLASFAARPGWLGEWLEALATAQHFRPLLFRPGGFLMLLALLRWRDPDARLLLALVLVPQTGLHYDALPAMLVSRTKLQALGLVVASNLGTIAMPFLDRPVGAWADATWLTGILLLCTVYLPALAIVLARTSSISRWLAARGARLTP